MKLNQRLLWFVVALAISGSGLLLAPSVIAGKPSKTTTFYVSPTGTDAGGYGTPTKPFKTISYALGKVTPGTTIIVMEGTYGEYLRTKTNGKPGQPITLQAQGHVVLTGDPTHSHLMDLWHDYYVLSGFEFTGREKLLWLQEADNNTISNNYFHHAQDECVRIKYQSTRNSFSRNRVEYCGLFDFGGGGTGKVGEGVYIGTAPEQLSLNPTTEVDHSNANTVSTNTFVTHGNECVDIKEGSEKNIVEFNDCTGQLDPNSGGFDSRGNYNTFRYNRSYNNIGAGIRFGGDTETDGTNNEAYGNELAANQNVALKVMRLPQGLICGNTATDNIGGFSNEPSIQNPPCTFPLPAPGVQ